MATLQNKDERDRFIKGIPDEPQEQPEDDGKQIEDVQEDEDGGATVTFEEDEAEETSGEFMDNLAEELDSQELQSIGAQLIDDINRDKEARKPRDEQQAEGIKRTGLGEDAPGGAAFDGASKVAHPLLTKAAVDFAARAMKELFPPSGPVKSAIYGNETEEKVVLAQKKARFMNWQATKQIPEYASELEVLLTQLPFGGSEYEKWRYDDRLDRPVKEFVPVDHVILPYHCTDFYSSPRVAHMQTVSRQEWDRRVASGLYADVDGITESAIIPDGTASDAASAKIEGVVQDPYNEDGLRLIYEVYIYLEIDGDKHAKGELAPYIITVDDATEKVCAIYRNWREEDGKRQKLDWMVEWKLLPWRGAYGIGLFHLIGGISSALTGSLRALLDSAHINNSPSLVKLKGGKTNGQSISVDPGSVAEIDAVAGVDDIRKTIMAMPYNAPSPVLFQLMDWLTQQGEGVLGTSEEKLDQVGDRTPVGTTQMLVEQGSQTYSSVHARLHRAQAKSLEILHRINGDFLDDKMVVEELDGLEIRRKDFKRSMDVVPVSDPNIFSDAQRFAQMQGVQQLIAMFPMLPWNMDAIARRMLTRMRIENIGELLPEQKKPQNLNPVAENIAAQHGTELLALPTQNHMAHIFAHLTFAVNPIFSTPSIGGKMMPIILEHVSQHMAFWYSEAMEHATNFNVEADNTPTVQIEQKLASANVQVLQQITTQMQQPIGQGKPSVFQMLQQVQQLAQQLAPKPPTDPAVEATMQVGMAEVNRKAQADQAELALKKQHLLSIQPQGQLLDAQINLIKNQQDNDQKAQTNLTMNQGDNETKQYIAAMQMNMQNMMQMFQQRMDAMQAQWTQQHEKNMAVINGQIQGALGQQQGAQQQVQQVQDQQHEASMQQNDQQHAAEMQQAQHQQQLEQQAQAAKLAPPPTPGAVQ